MRGGTILGVLMTMVLVLTACGGSDGVSADADTTVDPTDTRPTSPPATVDPAAPTEVPADEAVPENPVPDESDLEELPEEIANEIVEDVEAVQEALGGGGFTITVGDQTWVFDRVLCAFGEEEIGQEGAEFVLSAIQDGLQAYLSIDTFGYGASIDDIEDFANPSVGFSNFGSAEINLDGKNVSGSASFFDSVGDAGEVPGTFEGTCP